MNASYLPVGLFVALMLTAGTGRAADVFNVRDFGAKGDGVTPDTAAIQKAIDACGNGGGGTVLFPPGTYLSRPIQLRSRMTVRLEAGAIWLGSTNQADFMKVPGDWLKAKSGGDFIPLIGGKNLKDVTFTGDGVIDGSGGMWWEEAEKARRKVSGFTLPRPNLIVLERCQNVRLENITLRNSPKFHFVPSECDNVLISNVTILAPEHAANTDAIDPSDCDHVLITKCRIDVGDDNVAIKSGHPVPGRQFACENITVSDCHFLHGHGMSIGSETLGGVRNVLVTNCVFENTENGIRIKSQRGKGGRVEEITYTDLSMTNVDPAITFTCYYMSNSAKDPAQKPVPQNEAMKPRMANTPEFHNIRVKNLTATCQKSAGLIIGLPESVISDVVFENVRISSVTGLRVENASSIQFKDSRFDVRKGESCLLKNAQVAGLESRN